MSRLRAPLGRALPTKWVFVSVATACVTPLLCLLAISGCRSEGRSQRASVARSMDRASGVVALGNLSLSGPLTPAQRRLAEFLFGEAPQDGPAFFKPMDVAAGNGRVWVTDAGLAGVLEISHAGATRNRLDALAPGAATAVSYDSRIGLMVGDRAAGAIWVAPDSGQIAQRMGLAGGASHFSPAGIALAENLVWATNTAMHRIEVFDPASGQHVRSIGRRGTGSGEFGFPLGIAASESGEMYVVDLLNARVQVLGVDGSWKRNLGGSAVRGEGLGRPKDVAVGPDGAVFVTDAADARVHVFAADGQRIAVFGDGPAGQRLSLPAGIAFSQQPPRSSRQESEPSVAYYVLVAEQAESAGVRVFGWTGARPASAGALRPVKTSASVVNPHWKVSGCIECHGGSSAPVSAGGAAAIARTEIDALCMRCHDGVKATREAHPVGVAAEAEGVHAPRDWPLVDRRLSCLTCHDIAGHCLAPVRPAENPAFVRGFNPREPMAFCNHCHVQESFRFNPHEAVVSERHESGVTGCGFCHELAESGAASRGGSVQSRLRAPATTLCLNCHVRHADPAIRGHLDQAATGEYAPRTFLPIENGKITCSTCHNPHPAGTFPPGNPLGRMATEGPDARNRLRGAYADVCRACHPV